jgi:hypothetical protein
MQIKYAEDVVSTLWYHFCRLLTPSRSAALISANCGWAAIVSHRLMRNSRVGMMRNTVGFVSLEKLWVTFAGSYVKRH